MPTFDSLVIFGSPPIPVQNLALENRTSTPSSPIEGQTWIRTDLDQAFIWLNGAAVRFDAGGSLVSGTAAGGDLAGTYPNPTIGANKVTLAALALALLESGVSSGTAAAGDLALRKLGTGANDAMAGNTRLDQIIAPTTDVSMNGFKITNVDTPVSSTNAANKGYVDSVAQGLDAKASVKVATTAAGTMVSSFESGDTIDGIGLSTGDRILIKNQASALENGIYVVQASGTPVRANDMDVSAEFPGAFVFVEQGTVNADSGWVCTVDGAPTIGLTPIPWAQFSGAGSIIDGAGLTKTGNQLDVNVDGTTLEISSDALRIKALGVDLTTKVTGVLPAANGGRSAVVASPALTAGTYADVVHSLGVKAGRVVFKVASTGESVELDWRDKSGSETTTIQIKTDIVGGRAASFYDVYVSA